MKQYATLFFVLIALLFIPDRIYSQTSYTWTNPGSGGAWNNASNWTPGTGFPGNGDDAIINPTALITITNVPAISINSILIGGAALGDSVILTSATPDTLTINGSVTVTGGGIFAGANLGLKFISCSAYNHNMDGGNIPFATWGNNSNCNVTGIVTTQPGNMTQNFYNFLWDCPLQTSVVSFAGNIPTGIGGTCEFRRIGTSTQCNLIGGDGITRIWAGDLVVSANKIILCYSGFNATTLTVRDLYVNNTYGSRSRMILSNMGNTANYFTFNCRNVNVSSGGLIDFNGIEPNNTNMNVSGDLTMSSGSIYNSNSGYDAGASNFNFSGTTQQNVNITGGLISGNNADNGGQGPLRTLSITANAGSIVNFATPLVCNLGGTSALVTFNAAAGATLMIPDPAGILSTTGATTGSVRIPVGGSVTFSAGANYSYTGTVAQVTGSGLPATVNNFTVNNTSGIVSGVTLTNNLSINGALSLTNGNITLGAKNITLLTPATLSGAFSVSNMIVANSTGQFIRSIPTGSGSFNFPVGDATPYYSPVNLNFLANTTAGTIGARVTNSAEPNNNNPSAPSSYLSRYWTFSNTLLTNYSYTGTFAYPAANVVGTQSEIKLSQWNGASWFEDDTASSASSGVLAVTEGLSQTVAPLTGDFTGRTQSSASCTAPTLTAMANGTATSINICSGGAATSVSLTANPGAGSGCTGSFQYAWSNGINYWNGTAFASATPVFSSSYSSISYSTSTGAIYTVSGMCSNNTSCISSSAVSVNFPASVTPSVTIATQYPVINSGSTGTFTATSVNGGSSPSYQWKKNGTDVGTNSNTYTDTTLNNGDIITCTLTSNAGCPTSLTATSNAITMTIYQTFTPSITITASQTSICPGSSDTVTFTATTTYGGTLPSYQWRKNGVDVGNNAATYKDSSLNNSDVIYCVLTSNATCLSVNTVTSNSITISVGSAILPTITITASGDTVCAGTTVTFTAVSTNGGTTPAYQWKTNGINAGTNSTTYSGNNFSDNDIITCVLTSSLSCASPTSVTSNSITITVNPSILLSATISAPQTTICSGTPVMFTAVTNGGANATYQWEINEHPAGTNSADFTSSSLQNNDTVTCVLTSTAACTTGSPATSNAVVITISGTGSAGTLTAQKNPICSGDQALLFVTGSVGNVQWQSSLTGSTFTDINGADDTSYSSVLSQTTFFRVNTAGGGCSDTSAALQILVDTLPAPPVVTSNDTLICSGDSTQLCASGGYTSYLWNTGATTACTYVNAAQGYWVTATAVSGCSNVSSHFNISIFPVQSVSIVVQGDTLSSFNASGYQWYLNGSPISGATSPVYIATQEGVYSLQITDANGCKVLSDDVTTGISNLTDDRIEIYPNPSLDGHWQLKVDNSLIGSKLEIDDDNGRIVFESEISNPQSEIIYNGARGVYLLHIYNSTTSIIDRLVHL